MDFISNKEAQNRQMLETIGVESLDALFVSIPESIKLKRPEYDDGLSEYEGLKLMESLAKKNRFSDYESYLGAGSYEHHVPALVGTVCSKSEFLTSYTPYQAETSQGMLQIIFEYQSAVCALTGMDVSNASVYDGASACAEAMLMALRTNNRSKIVVAGSLHLHYKGVIDQYLASHGTRVEVVPVTEEGTLNQQFLEKAIDEETAAVLVQYPNFFGLIEDLKAVFRLAKERGSLGVVCANPLVYGLYENAAELGADIAVGDLQPFGLNQQFGGPYVGYIACRQEYVRQLPGRIVGETLDTKGGRGFVLTLQAREQHIRREKATSNICTNQALAALASLVAMLWYGKRGVKELALTNYQRAAYLKDSLESKGFKTISGAPIFNEFAVEFNQPIETVLKHFRAHGIEPGVELKRFFPQFSRHLLVAVTETKTLEQLERYVRVAGELK